MRAKLFTSSMPRWCCPSSDKPMYCNIGAMPRASMRVNALNHVLTLIHSSNELCNDKPLIAHCRGICVFASQSPQQTQTNLSSPRRVCSCNQPQSSFIAVANDTALVDVERAPTGCATAYVFDKT